jgi:hypothetical protein
VRRTPWASTILPSSTKRTVLVTWLMLGVDWVGSKTNVDFMDFALIAGNFRKK